MCSRKTAKPARAAATGNHDRVSNMGAISTRDLRHAGTTLVRSRHGWYQG
jgi:hypothetical protein